MNEQEKTRIQHRVETLYRYTNAMEQGDDATVTAVLAEATQDRALERMILEVNEVYQIEDRTVVHADDVAAAHELLLDIFAEPIYSPSAETGQPVGAQQLTTQKNLRPLQPQPLVARQLPARKWYQSRMTALVAVALLAVLIIPTVSAFAPQFLALFRPQQFTSVNTNVKSPEELMNNLTNFLRHFGDNTTQNYASKHVITGPLNQTSAELLTGFHIQLPDALPSGVGHTAEFIITPDDQETFTFSTSKTRDYLQKTGQSAVAIPARLEGSSFTITLSPGVIVRYHNHCAVTDGKQQCSGGLPFAISEIPSPTIQATGGASLSDLRNFLLSLPQLPQDMHTLVQRADVSNGVVPVPIPAGASSEQPTIKGARGLLVTLDGNSGIIWQSQNMLYIILAANVNSTQLQTIANELH